MKRYLFLLMIPALLFVQHAHADAELKQEPARATSYAKDEMLLGIAHAGKRLVAVGDHGVILLSDDAGKSFRQAKSVPTRVTLNSVSFANQTIGWAAGHWGTILKTTDGGETWTLQRTDTTTDRPLFAIQALDTEHAVTVGLWSLILSTDNGGAQWGNISLTAPPGGGKADRNLFGLFLHKDTLYATAERGLVLSSKDKGKTWSYLATGYIGTFWTGLALNDGTLIVAGLRGTIYRSNNAGKTWQKIESNSKSSITAITQINKDIVAVGLDGSMLRSRDEGKTFRASQRDDHAALTAVTGTETSGMVLLSKAGILDDSAPSAPAH